MNLIASLVRSVLGLVLGTALSLLPALAQPSVTAWSPLFKGIDHLSGTNLTTSGDFENLMVIQALRVDLRDPDIRLFSTPPIDNYQVNFRETAGHTVSQFLRTNKLQVAINAGFFTPTENYLPDGTAMTTPGLLISQGTLVSPATINYSASLLVGTTNDARIIHTNWPASSTDGVWTAVSGDYPVLVKGVNVGKTYRRLGGIHGVHPRTAIGLSEDQRYLFLLVIDGRQNGYSEGALDSETAAWLQLLGAYDGINMDGGGSSTMVMEDSLGNPLRLNRSSTVADSGKERTVGCHLGIYAQPVSGYIKNLTVIPDDEAATITWTTPEPSTTALEYGVDSNLGQNLQEQPTLTQNHSVLLTGLQPGTDYQIRAVSQVGGQRYETPLRGFKTLSYLETNSVVGLTDSWKFSADVQTSQAWATTEFNDSAWQGPGEGLLWADVRSSGPNPTVGPRGAQLSVNTATGFPYVTYYFRRHFQSKLAGVGASLAFSGYIDDGAVVYLNGNEIYRLRMDPAPSVLGNDTLAIGFPCGGDADCRDEWWVGGDVSRYLVPGDNVLAVEVHNYNRRSADITFGLEVSEARSLIIPPILAITGQDGVTSLQWSRGGFVLQSAESPDGPWFDMPGPVLVGPYRVEGSAPSRYYRLRR